MENKPALRAHLRAARDAMAGAAPPRPAEAFLAHCAGLVARRADKSFPVRPELVEGRPTFQSGDGLRQAEAEREGRSDVEGVPVVATYLPIGGEADPRLFDAAARGAGCRLALPHATTRTAPLRFLAHPGAAALVPGPFGPQPPADSPALVPGIILAPLVGFDRRGGRLGQGGGHYDRAFAHWPDAWRVGIAWAVQEVEAVPAEPWDVPLHAIATEKEWIEP